MAGKSCACAISVFGKGIDAPSSSNSVYRLKKHRPVDGAFFGEMFYKAKRNILENDGCIGDSKAWGTVALWAMDPITEAGNLIWGDDKPINETFTFSSQPTITPSGNVGYGLRLGFSF